MAARYLIWAAGTYLAVPKHRHGVTFTRHALNTDRRALVIPGDPVLRMQPFLGRHLIGPKSKTGFIKLPDPNLLFASWRATLPDYKNSRAC